MFTSTHDSLRRLTLASGEKSPVHGQQAERFITCVYMQLRVYAHMCFYAILLRYSVIWLYRENMYFFV